MDEHSLDIIIQKVLGRTLLAAFGLVVAYKWKNYYKNRKIKSKIDPNTNMDEGNIHVLEDLSTSKTINLSPQKNISLTINKLIEEKNLIKVNETIDGETFEILAKNHDYSTIFITISGNLRRGELEYSCWSETNNSKQRNDGFLYSFKRELEYMYSNNDVSLATEIKNEIGLASFKRWDELTRKMIYESKKQKDQCIKELVGYGLKEELAEKLVHFYVN